MPALVSRGRVKLGKFAVIVNRLLAGLVDRVVHLHYCPLVAASVAVVGSREHCYHSLIVLPLVSLHHELVSTGDEVQAVDMSELFGDILAKRVASAPW